MIAIFSLKLLFFLGIFIQSCSSDIQFSATEEENAQKFLSSLKESKQLLASVPISLIPKGFTETQKSELQSGEYDRETYYLSAGVDDELQVPVDQLGLDEVQTLEEIFILKDNYHLELLHEVRNEDYLAAYELPVEPIMTALEPSVQASKEFFYAKGFSDLDIVEMLDGEDEAALIPIVMEVSRSVNSNDYSASIIDFTGLFGQSAYAATVVGDARSCFLDATGIAAGAALVSALTAQVVQKTLVKQLVKEAVKKIGGRVLGGIGLALIVIDFSLCMGDVY